MFLSHRLSVTGAQRVPLHRLVPVGVACVLLGACARAPESSPPAEARQAPDGPAAATEAGDAIVARVGQRTVTAREADASIALALHDLEMQKYRLRRQALEAELLREFEGAPDATRVAEILLDPPAPLETYPLRHRCAKVEIQENRDVLPVYP